MEEACFEIRTFDFVFEERFSEKNRSQLLIVVAIVAKKL